MDDLEKFYDSDRPLMTALAKEAREAAARRRSREAFELIQQAVDAHGWSLNDHDRSMLTTLFMPAAAMEQVK